MTRVLSLTLLLVGIIILFGYLLKNRTLTNSSESITITVWDNRMYNYYDAKTIIRKTERCIDFIDTNNKERTVCGENYSIN